jgi:hypothetical protein
MVKLNDVTLLEISETQIKNIIKKVLVQDFNKIDNLRTRHPNIQFDCLLRGYIGEEALVNWFSRYEIYFQNINKKVNENYDIDIDLVYIDSNNSRILNIEVKTSLVPDIFVASEDDKFAILEKVLKNCDIKLIRRERLGKKEKIEDLWGDIYIQIYFTFFRKKRDNFLRDLKINLNIENATIEDSFTSLIDEIYNKTQAYLYMDNTFLVGWIDKETLIQLLNTKYFNDPTWNYGKREFWRCNIEQDAKSPLELIDYLKNLK